MSKKETKVSPIPYGMRSITPHLTTSNVAETVAMYQEALGATLVSSQTIPDTDTIIFAMIKVGNSQLTVGHGEAFGPGSVSLHLYVEDAQVTWDNAVKAGFVVINPLKERYWGDLTGLLTDPVGVRWSIGQRFAKMNAKERESKAKEAMEKASAKPAKSSETNQPEPAVEQDSAKPAPEAVKDAPKPKPAAPAKKAK